MQDAKHDVKRRRNAKRRSEHNDGGAEGDDDGNHDGGAKCPFPRLDVALTLFGFCYDVFSVSLAVACMVVDVVVGVQLYQGVSPIPSKAFPVKVVDANGSSTLHVVQLSLCEPTDQPPRGADSCGVAAYYGEWSSMGACEAQFDAVRAGRLLRRVHSQRVAPFRSYLSLHVATQPRRLP